MREITEEMKKQGITESYLIQSEIGQLKYDLKQTDYIMIKLMEADTEEERTQLRQKYADIINQRKQWRIQINQLEEELSSLNNNK